MPIFPQFVYYIETLCLLTELCSLLKKFLTESNILIKCELQDSADSNIKPQLNSTVNGQLWSFTLAKCQYDMLNTYCGMFVIWNIALAMWFP